jgi:nucleoside-diphosphate-sugar epimerase
MARVRPRMASGLAFVEVDGEIVVYDAREGKLRFLNHAAATVFSLCDGSATIGELAQEIADAYEESPETIEPIVRSAIRQLRKENLLVPPSPGPAQDHEHPHVHMHEVDGRARVRRVVPRST